eukprot:2656762-Rhodomonas_salina.1
MHKYENVTIDPPSAVADTTTSTPASELLRADNVQPGAFARCYAPLPRRPVLMPCSSVSSPTLPPYALASIERGYGASSGGADDPYASRRGHARESARFHAHVSPCQPAASCCGPMPRPALTPR